MSDRRPLKFVDRFLWHPQPADAPDEQQHDYLPPDVFARLTGHIDRGPAVARMVKSYTSETEAMAALWDAERCPHGERLPCRQCVANARWNGACEKHDR